MHLASPRSSQHSCGLRHRAARSINIVAQQHALACHHSLRPLAQLKAAAQLLPPLLGRKLKQGRRAARSGQKLRLKLAAALL